VSCEEGSIRVPVGYCKETRKRTPASCRIRKADDAPQSGPTRFASPRQQPIAENASVFIRATFVCMNHCHHSDMARHVDQVRCVRRSLFVAADDVAWPRRQPASGLLSYRSACLSRGRPSRHGSLVTNCPDNLSQLEAALRWSLRPSLGWPWSGLSPTETAGASRSFRNELSRPAADEALNLLMRH
jgi:hypothetical protein